MSLIKYRDPFAEFGLLSDSFFDSIFQNLGDQSKGYPKYDQYNREDGSVVLESPLAGYKAAELSVTVEGQKLVVSAEKAQKRQDGDRTVTGRSTASFERVFTADRNLDLDKLKATFEDGLLVIEVPSKGKPEAPKVKRIDIVTPKALPEHKA